MARLPQCSSPRLDSGPAQVRLEIVLQPERGTSESPSTKFHALPDVKQTNMSLAADRPIGSRAAELFQIVELLGADGARAGDGAGVRHAGGKQQRQPVEGARGEEGDMLRRGAMRGGGAVRRLVQGCRAGRGRPAQHHTPGVQVRRAAPGEGRGPGRGVWGEEHGGRQ